MADTVRTESLRDYLKGLAHPPWEDAHPPEVRFLARGEYSVNYRVAGDYVVRLVTGSQIGLPLAEQAPYEYHALELLAPSEATPRPYRVDPDPDGLAYPVIIEEYLPGRALDYATDIPAAARCVAAIHGLGVPADHDLQVHPDPGPAIVEESRKLADPYLAWPGAQQPARQALRGAFSRVEGLAEGADLVAEDDLAIVNYDLNTHNFVVDDGVARLLDWEKARIAPLTQDLAHFLLPTTTLWRDETATRLSDAQEQAFLDTYLEHNPRPDPAGLLTRLEAMRVLVSLRAVCWCAWALQETAQQDRPIVNEETLQKARMYLKPSFLRELFEL